MNRLDTEALDGFADDLLALALGRPAELAGRAPITALSLEQAYELQARVVAQRVSRGERVVGYKVGCTSRAVRTQLGLDHPVAARLLHPHVHFGDSRLSWSDYPGCAVEAELVFGMARDVTRPLRGEEEARAALEFVAPGIEVHRYRFLYGAPTTQELIAGNCLHGGLVVGESRTRPQDVDLEMEGVALFVDGQLEASAVSAETMASPLRSVVWLSEQLVARGEALKAGDLVIPGAPVRLVEVARGASVCARFTRCGEVRAEFL